MIAVLDLRFKDKYALSAILLLASFGAFAQTTAIRLWKVFDDDTKQPVSLDMWEDGEILDPDNGKLYRVRLKLLDAGKKLEVRGFIGPFFRNQHWLRAE